MDALREAESAEEIVAIAREKGVEVSAEEAKIAYAAFHPADGEIADEELDNVAGGGCGGARRDTCSACGEPGAVIIDSRTQDDAGGTYAIVTYQCRRCRHTWKGEVIISGYY